jgi:colanic acid/amylovoran biosynthesis glycosyltransferase
MTIPLRIAFFLYEFPALSETFVLNQITGLIDLGHDVTIFAERPRPDQVAHPDVAAYRLAERTCYLDMPEPRLARILQAPRQVRRVRRRVPLRRVLDLRRYGNEARSLRLYYWAARLAEHDGFDIIHCHFGPRGRMAGFLREIGAISGKLVTVFHGVDVSAYLRHHPDIYRHLFGHGDLFLPVSESWRTRLIEHGCDPTRTRVHRMGVDLERFPFRPLSHAAGQPLRVLTIGRMIEKKGIAYGLRAVAELRARQAPVRYTVVGDGPERRALEALAGQLELTDIVSFLGWQDQRAVAQLMRKSDVLLAPSVTDAHGDQEGIPVTLMEAMATGMPVVSTRHSGIPELIEDETSGFLAAERDVPGLVNALQRLGQDPGLATRIGRAARARIAVEFDVQLLNRRLISHYEELLKNGPESPQRASEMEPVAQHRSTLERSPVVPGDHVTLSVRARVQG